MMEKRDVEISAVSICIDFDARHEHRACSRRRERWRVGIRRHRRNRWGRAQAVAGVLLRAVPAPQPTRDVRVLAGAQILEWASQLPIPVQTTSTIRGILIVRIAP